MKKLKPQLVQKRLSKFKAEPVVEINDELDLSSSKSDSDMDSIDQSMFKDFDFTHLKYTVDIVNAAKPKPVPFSLP